MSGQTSVGSILHWTRLSRHRSGRFLAGAVSISLAVTLGQFVGQSAAGAAPKAPQPGAAEALERPDEAAAVITARMTGKKVKITGLTSETAEYFALPDGKVESTTHAAPVRLQRAGKWVPVDLNLVRNADGSVAAKAHPFDLKVAGKRDGGDGELAGVGWGDDRVSMGWSGALPEPVLTGNRATYPNVQPDVDLVVEATRAGVEQFVVVKSRAAVAKLGKLTVPLTGKSVASHTRDESGAVALKDKSGRTIATAPTPYMWDAQVGPDGETPARQAPVPAAAKARPAQAAKPQKAAKDGRKAAPAQPAQPAGVELTLTPDANWLNDPATVFPVTIDPQLNPVAKSTYDTYVKESDNGNHGGAKDLQLGLLDGNPKAKTRAFVHWDTKRLKYKRVSDARAYFYNFWSQVCTPVSWEIWTTGAASDNTRWTSQPQWIARDGVSTETKGGGKNCTNADGWVSVPATSFFQRAASSAQDVAYMGVRSSGETNINGFKQFRSRNADDNAQVPYAKVTYTSLPSAGARSTVPATACATGAARPFINTKTPTLRSTVNHADGVKVKAWIDVWPTGGTASISMHQTAMAAPGSVVAATVPAGRLAEGANYSWRTAADDGTTFSADGRVDKSWSGWCEFTVDTTAPATPPAVTSAEYPAGRWGGSPTKAGTFTFSSGGVSDVAAYEYGLDTDPPTQRVNASAVGGNASVQLAPGSDGPHTLYVRSRDRAGNLSPVTRYTFNVGSGAVTNPDTGDIITGTTSLEGIGQTDASGVAYQWRRGDADVWLTIPTADVTLAEGGGAVSWPLRTSGGGNFPKLNWNVAKTVNDAEAGPDPLDGPLQVQAVYGGAGAGVSSAVKFTLDRDRASAAVQEVGPGTVNVVTGNLAITESDIAADSVGAELALTRSYGSRQSGGTDPMFGPGWVSSVGIDESTAPYTALQVTGSLAQVGLSDGSSVGFVRKAGTATGDSFEPQVGAEDLTLQYTRSTDRYALRRVDGTVVTFGRTADTPVGQYLLLSVDAGASNKSATVSWEKTTVDGVTVMRPTRILAEVPTGVNCTAALVKGCRALTFSYATATTANGGQPAQWGDYAGRLREATFTAYDPATDKMVNVVLARYSYDATGRLRSGWDPRLDYDGGKHVGDTYGYDAEGVLAELRPAGQEPWRFSYTTIPDDPGKGRLHQVTRSALTAGTATNTVVYKVPTAGAGAPYDMSAARTGRWGQKEQPVEATAVFGPDQLPDGNQREGRLPASYERAVIAYLDANGRDVNVVTPGGHTTATWYTPWGDVARTMTAGNISRALGAADNDNAQQEAELAQRLSTVNVYSPDGQRLVESFGPEHDVTLPQTGATVRGRQHKTIQYDEGAPAADGPFHLPTTESTSVSYPDNGGLVDAEARVTKTQYDWELRLPTVRVVDPAGLKLTTRMAYDPDTGLQVSSTNPGGGAADNTPSTRRTVYYRAGTGSGYAECDNKPHWAELVCREQAGGQAGTGPQLPVIVTTYDLYQRAAKQVEKVGDSILRTVVTRYDAAGRPAEVEVDAAGQLGKAVPITRNVYDKATGVVARTQSVDAGGNVTAEVVREFDGLGRLVSYTDADRNVSTTTYDLLGRTATSGNGRTQRTYTYDGGDERRGLPTKVTDTLSGGAFGAEFDADGNPVREVWPNGVTVTSEYDETGTKVKLAYERPGCGQDSCGVYYDVAGNNVHGQKRWTASTLANRVYDYDAAGRMHYTTETVKESCTVRKYGFDAAGNRKSLNVYAAAQDGNCQTGEAAVSKAYNYDSADRITGGYVYDALGRTTTVPAADTANPGGGDLTVEYHSTDLVQSITQGGRTTSYTLDVNGERIRSWTDATASASPMTRRHHYEDDSDSPAWTDEGDNTVTAPVTGIVGMAGTWTATGVDWRITNLHGDLVATIHDTDAGLSATHEYDEYGTPHDLSTAGADRYGWLGAHQRAADAPTGIVLMGVRLYNTVTGRFLSVDPVYDGSCNRYDYACADPVNKLDVDGKALPAVILALVAIARGLYALYQMGRAAWLACRVARSWCGRALKYIGQQSMRYLRSAYRWISAKLTLFLHSSRVRNAYKCANRLSDFFHYTFGKVAADIWWPGSARTIGWVLGFAYGYWRNFSCFKPGKYW